MNKNSEKINVVKNKEKVDKNRSGWPRKFSVNLTDLL